MDVDRMEHVSRGRKSMFGRTKRNSKNSKKGDCVEFDAEVYRYLRVKNQTIDFGIRNPSFIEKIGEYDLPTEQELREQFLRQVRCEICLLSDHCDRIFCLKG